MSALISIIVPVYNQEKYLSRCLDSILDQTYKNLEIVCVDDKSTDGSTEIIKHYVQKNSRIVYYRNTGKGVSSARNYGIERANGEYIGFVDSDDFIQPQMYEFMLRAMQENDCEMVACGYERVDRADYRMFEYHARECKTSEFVDLYNFENMLNNEMVLSSACTKLIKTEFLKKIDGLFEDHLIGEDTIFCAKLWTKVKKNVYVDVPLYGYFVNLNSTIYRTDDSIKISLMESRLEAYRLYKNYDRETAAYFLFRDVVCMQRYICMQELSDKRSYRIMNRKFFEAAIPFLMLKNIKMKEKLYYVFNYISKLFIRR